MCSTSSYSRSTSSDPGIGMEPPSTASACHLPQKVHALCKAKLFEVSNASHVADRSDAMPTWQRTPSLFLLWDKDRMRQHLLFIYFCIRGRGNIYRQTMGPGDICTNVVTSVMWGTYQIIETRGMCVWEVGGSPHRAHGRHAAVLRGQRQSAERRMMESYSSSAHFQHGNYSFPLR